MPFSPPPHRHWKSEWLILIGALLVLGGFVLYSIWQEHQSIETKEADRLKSLTLIAHDAISNQFGTINQALRLLRQDWLEQGSQTQGLERLNNHLQTFAGLLQGVHSLMVLDANGRVLVANLPELVGMDFSQRNYFLWASVSPNADRLYVGPPFTTALGAWTISLSLAILAQDGEFAGLVTATLDEKAANSLLASLRYTQDTRTALVHSDGRLFLTSPVLPELQGKSLNQSGMLFRRHRTSGQAFSLFNEFAHLSQDNRLLVLRNIQPSTMQLDHFLVVAASRNLDAIYLGWWARSQKIALLFALLALASMGGLFSLQRHQRRIDAERLAQQKRLSLLAESVPGMVYQFIMTPDGKTRFAYASPNTQPLYELTPADILKDAGALFSRIHADDRGRVAEGILASARALTPWEEEYRVVLPQGGERWLAGRSQPQRLDDGQIIWHGHVYDITQAKLQELALREAKEAAEAASRAKDQFIANMSHEIRTPLNATLGNLQLLEDSFLDGQQQASVANAKTAASLLLAILNDILDFSKAEAGQLVLNRAPFCLFELLGNLEVILSVMARNKGLELRLDLDTRLPRVVQGDALRLQQVLLNLAGNAIKFTEQGCVCVYVHQIKGHAHEVMVQFTVKDTGPGIAPERLEVIFERFHQEDASIARRYGGTGLGLPISQRLVRLMGGEIRVSSHPGQGSDFTFVLTLPWSLEDQALNLDHIQEQDQKEVQGQPLAGLRLLLVEDNPLNQALARTLLTQAGAEVLLASTGKEAVDIIRRGQPGVHAVLMDIQMPEMDGYEATRLIRAQVGRALPIIAMTAHSQIGDRQASLDADMDGHITKPFAIQGLIALLLHHLGRSGHRPLPALDAAPDRTDFDTESALHRLGNNRALYARLLSNFAASQADLPDQLAQALAQGDRASALRHLHSLKGLAASLGAMALSRTAARAEIQLKQDANSPDWPKVTAELGARLRLDIKAMQALARYFGFESGQAEPVVREQPEEAVHHQVEAWQATQATEAAELERAQILLVDDQPINLEILKEILGNDYQLLEASSGGKALALCRQQRRPDLVLLDVLMPDMDGLEVCRQLKADPLTADIPIIFITAQTTADEESAALDCGGVDFISKPINPAVVRARVKTQITLKAQHDQLQALAKVDGLTGVANRRRFDEVLRNECQRALRTHSPLALLMIDIDHFKAYNDHYGHQQGDSCLQQVAASLAAGCHRAQDLVARYGGEEFACILPDCDMDDAKTKAEALREGIARLQLPHAASPLAPQVSISIGVALCRLAGENGAGLDAKRLIAVADQALYAAKAAGRNRVMANTGP
jgi:diguanylate cyclase (GGDEF)-like protein